MEPSLSSSESSPTTASSKRISRQGEGGPKGVVIVSRIAERHCRRPPQLHSIRQIEGRDGDRGATENIFVFPGIVEALADRDHRNPANRQPHPSSSASFHRGRKVASRLQMSRLAASISTTRPAMTSATTVADGSASRLADGNQTGRGRGGDGGDNLVSRIQTGNVHSGTFSI